MVVKSADVWCVLHRLCAAGFIRVRRSDRDFCISLTNVRSAYVTGAVESSSEKVIHLCHFNLLNFFVRSLEALDVAEMLKLQLKNLNLSCCSPCAFLLPHYASPVSSLLSMRRPVHHASHFSATTTNKRCDKPIRGIGCSFLPEVFASDLQAFWTDFLYLLRLVCGSQCLHAFTFRPMLHDSGTLKVWTPFSNTYGVKAELISVRPYTVLWNNGSSC